MGEANTSQPAEPAPPEPPKPTIHEAELGQFVDWLYDEIYNRTIDPDEATRIIAGPFEGYLEKVFG